MRSFNIAPITEEMRQVHPYLDDACIAMTNILNGLTNEEIMLLLKYDDICGEISKSFLEAYPDDAWVTNPMFVVNRTVDIALNRGIFNKQEEWSVRDKALAKVCAAEYKKYSVPV